MGENTIEVHSQEEFDAIPENYKLEIIIEAEEPIAIKNRDVKARGKSHVIAYGNSNISAYETARVTAYDYCYVDAHDNSHVWIHNRCHAYARNHSTVISNGHSVVVATNDSTIFSYDNSSVIVYDSAIVNAYFNSDITGFDNAHIVSFNQSVRIRAYANATVKQYAVVSYTKEMFLQMAQKEGDSIVLYKSVEPETFKDFFTGTITYKLNKDIVCPDWIPDKDIYCGNGLHLCLHPAVTQTYNKGIILKCLVDPKDIVVNEDDIRKVRCRKVRPVAIVDMHGRVLSGYEVLTRKEVASLFNVAPQTVSRWVKQGKLRAIKVGRKLIFDRTDIDTNGGKENDKKRMEG